MKNIIYLFLFSSFIYSQCDYSSENSCNLNEDCEWIEDIQLVTCDSLVLDQELCEAAPECTYSCDDGGGYFGWCNSSCYGGMTYIDNGYCQEIEMPECSGLEQGSCNHPLYGEGCEWIEDIEYGSCSGLSHTQCNSGDYGSCEWECIEYGWWYDWCYTSACTGGTYEIDNGSCEEVPYELGDINGDLSINVIDVVETVNLIIDGGYNVAADIDSNGVVNVLDIIQLINIIIDRS